MSEIPDWFWEIIESAGKQMSRLEASLENLDRRRLEDYYGYHELASSDLSDYTDGPYINEAIGYLSEDGCEDLCDWIVSMGRVYWTEVMEERRSLAEAFWQMDASSRGIEDAPGKWDTGVNNPRYLGYQTTKALAIPILEARFGIDFYDVRDEILYRVGY